MRASVHNKKITELKTDNLLRVVSFHDQRSCSKMTDIIFVQEWPEDVFLLLAGQGFITQQ